MTLFPAARAVAIKDLTVEIRARRAVGAAAPFVGTVLVSFGLALGPGRTLLHQVAPGVLWLSVLFASVLTVRHGWAAEMEDDAVEAFVLAGMDDASVFLGKAAALTIELLALEIFTVLLTSLLFDRSFLGQPLLLLAALILGTIGLSVVGSLFGLVASSPRAGDGSLPLLLLPLASPVLLAGVQATGYAIAGQPGRAGPWLGLLSAFDLTFLAVGIVVFEHLLEER
jgi:heme exporter protein B